MSYPAGLNIQHLLHNDVEKFVENQRPCAEFFFYFMNHGSLDHPWFMPFSLYHTILTSNDPEREGFEKHCGKGENAGNQHFLLFSQCFLPFPKQFFKLFFKLQGSAKDTPVSHLR